MNKLEGIKNRTYVVMADGQVQARVLMPDFDWLIQRVTSLEEALNAAIYRIENGNFKMMDLSGIKSVVSGVNLPIKSVGSLYNA